jgi:type I restriction enzyme R subunit
MSTIGQIERATQARVVYLFQDKLKYRYLGNLEETDDNANIIQDVLIRYLAENKLYSPTLISKALYQFTKAAADQSKSLYEVNKQVYSLLRYGVKVKEEVGENTQTVELIDWKEPLKNDFAIAEEVTIKGEHTKRPDIVLYINGIAIGVMELKRSTVSVSEGIRQNLDNQKHIFIRHFFTTIQYVMAGNDTEGLRYGAIDPETNKEKYYLKWKEVSEEFNAKDPYLLEITKPIRELADSVDCLLDKHIIQLFNKERLIEFIHDFIVFDRGIKKLSRHNQYFGVKATQERVRKKEGGIIWHTQGSGKSLTMVWTAKWIREYNSSARVLIITDRDELDKQIEKVFKGVDEQIFRCKPQDGKSGGTVLIEKLNDTKPWLLCSLIHKFGNKEEADYETYITDLKNSLPPDFKAKGDFYVFVDECHRTQSGDLHKAMKKILPDAMFIGFTGTPLLKTDKQTSLEIFGTYIHTYKFDEAVADKVVLDLRYEARDVDQKITSMEHIDKWFEAKTKGLSDLGKSELKQRWGTMKTLFSSLSRLQKIVADVMLDMETKERLQNGRGNAILISGSIYNACRYYELFQNAGLKKCAIVTSFVPTHADIKGEETGEGYTEKLMQYEIYQKMLGGKTPEVFEDEAKKTFVEEPAQLKLLVVVDKLLTGFDAPPATYLYIDKSMKDHGLFQAICRVNRLDGDDKEYGYVIDYKDLFSSLEQSVKDYTSGAFEGYAKEDVEGLLGDRIKKGRERLDESLETLKELCEPVDLPKGTPQFIRYFCGNTEIPDDIKDKEPRRVAFYKAVLALIRAYANIAEFLEEAGYTSAQIDTLKADLKLYESLRKEIQLASGDYVALKQFEPAMRYLIDTYIGADESRLISNFDDLSLVELIVERGAEALEKVPERIRRNKEAMAETIENNLRKVIIEESPTNPRYYERMSTLLDELIKLRRQDAAAYEDYLKKIVELTRQIKKPEKTAQYPSTINTKPKRALYDNLNRVEELAIDLDKTICMVKDDDWRGTLIKRRKVEITVKQIMERHGITDPTEVARIYELVYNQKMDY